MRTLRFLSAALVVGLLAAQVQAGPVPLEIQVGYADGLRGGLFFPSPWFGDAGVQSFNGNSGGGIDSGAIRLINNDVVSHTITGLHVDGFDNGADFKIWDASFPIVLLPGNSAIFTENSGNNFDSSDQPIVTVPGTNTGLPVVHFIIDGSSLDATDTKQVLNTEGFDPGFFGTNENHAWRDIGTVGGPAGTPEPGSITLLGFGIAGLVGYGWRKRKAAAA